MLDLFAELTGLTSEIRELRLVHTRIAEALERLSPPLHAPASDSRDGAAASGPARPLNRDANPDDGFHMAESPEEYQTRIDSEAALAASLGVAPWSPEFQRTIMEIRAELMTPRRTQDEEGNWTDTPALSAEEAEDAIRQGFQLAKAAANERSDAGA